MIPLTIKQQKNSVKMAALKPQMEEINAKYKGNREKINQEMMALYQKEGYNPTAGCLPLLIQMPILFGLIDVVYRPLTHILHLSQEVIDAGFKMLAVNGGTERFQELNLFREIQAEPARFAAALGADVVENVQSLSMNFIGIDLSGQPAMSMLTQFNPLIFIPIMAGITSMLFSLVSMRVNPMPMEGSAGASMKSMMYIMPIVSVMFTFSIPAGVGFYWSCSNLIGIGQSVLMNKLYNPKEMAEKARAELEERREKERQERIEAKKLQKAGLAESGDEKGLSQKEINRRRIADARRREAEKYGEEYVED